MEKNLFKSNFSSTVKVKSSDSNKTVFEVMGVPYGGPDYLGGKDLHGERFTKNTDYGKDPQGNVIVNTIYAFYDHAMNDSIGKEQIGYAKFFQETDEGQVWEIEVMRAYRYHDMLLALAQKNLLGASSQPVQTAVDIDYETGDIKRWYPAEISLTPTPANPNAVMQVLKSLNIDFKMEDGILDEDKDKKDELENKEGETDELPDLETVIADAFEGDSTDEDTVELGEVKSVLADIVKSLATLSTEVAAIKSAQATAVDQKALAVELGKINAGVREFAVGVAKSLKTQLKTTIAELDKKSTVESELDGEIDGEEQHRRQPVKSVIPAGAPGSRKVNQ